MLQLQLVVVAVQQLLQLAAAVLLQLQLVVLATSKVTSGEIRHLMR